MNEKEVIAFLNSAKQVPPAGAVERCIAALPNVHKPSCLLPLIKLQLISMPAYLFVLALTAITLQILLIANLHPTEALIPTGISSAVVALLFIWHFMLSRTGSIAEIEQCCKYNYGQILFSRILCLGGTTLSALLTTTIPGSVINGMGLRFILATLLPTLIGALAALLWVNYASHSEMAMMVIYLVSALVTGLMLEKIVEMGVLLSGAILLATFTVLFIQMKNLMSRRIRYEAYNY